MYFLAEMNGRKFHMEVLEGRSNWTVSLQEDDKKKEIHRIPKSQYMRMDDAISFLFENSSYMIDVAGEGQHFNVYTRGSYREIKLYNDEMLLHESLKKGTGFGAGDNLAAGMPGKIVDIYVKAGDAVKAGQSLLIMEAMKMENEIKAVADTVVKEIKVEKGQSVESGAVLIVFGE
ncbi:MAG: acetyl-CoA carboxylase biotin carboxyl carrier protein subunit [Bdellovibrionales bacterium CG10_big_fil_rev_8_21_14_0_10_45_34]|nr:MAG: acetyl-CoA carboxylase biotin carboxyl carrier protein subunit [Bdellovibrionales bacterium CG10_big_fil_rev_8_21_14_0_10_45_34]